MSSNISFIAKIAEKILKFTKPDYMDDKQKIDEFLNERLKQEDKPPKSKNISGVEVFDFGNESSDTVVIYIHGGAYVNEINMQHKIFCWYLARKLKINVIAPVYPLAPKYNAKKTFDLILKLYKEVLNKHSKIVLMGDSAGGGFVLSFSQYLNSIDITGPDNLIVFSPWVDISMSNPPYDSENDPILGEVGLKEIGRRWAGNLSTADYRVSPIFGDVLNQATTLIFAGSEEIFYRDIKKYADKLKDNGVDVELITGEGLFHIYPLFPIPEAKKAFNIIKSKILM